MKQKKSDVVQLGMMLVLTCITQVLIMAKSSLIAANFGASMELDAYNFANNIATFLLTFASGGITTVIIPAFVKKKSPDAINSFITIVYGCIAMLLMLMYFLRDPIIGLLTSRDAAFKIQVSKLLFLNIVIQWIPAMLGITTAYFQCIDKYLIPKISLLISNIYIVGSLWILQNFTIEQYMMYLIAGAIINLAFDVFFALKYGFRFKPCFKIRNEEFKNMLIVFVPIIFSSGVFKIHSMVDSVIASNLGEGQITILSYSNMMVSLINTLFIGNLTVYIYPKLVKKVANEKQEGINATWNFCAVFHLVVCLLIAGVIVIGREGMSVLLVHGKFSQEAANSAYVCLCIYVMGQQFNIVRDLIYRYFYIQGDTQTTFKNSLFVSVLNIILSVILAQKFGIYGVAIGTVTAGVCSLLLISRKFSRQYGRPEKRNEMIGVFLRNYIIFVGTIAVCMVAKHILPEINDLIAIFVYGILCTGIYIMLTYVLQRKYLKKDECRI